MKLLFDLQPDDPRVQALCSSDAHMAQLVGVIGAIAVPARDNAFEALAKSLIGQQLSVKAAETICRRVVETCGGLSTEVILAAADSDLRTAGVSGPKIGYIKGLAQLVERQELDLERLDELEDEAIVGALMKVKGVGRWTAEMFLIFVHGSEDVLSLGDAGLRRAASWLYGGDGGADDFVRRSGQWKPYRTIASLYLWEAINRGHVSAGPWQEAR